MLLTSLSIFTNAVSNLAFCGKSYVVDGKYQNDFGDIMKLKPINKEGKEKINSIESIEFQNISLNIQGPISIY